MSAIRKLANCVCHKKLPRPDLCTSRRGRNAKTYYRQLQAIPVHWNSRMQHYGVTRRVDNVYFTPGETPVPKTKKKKSDRVSYFQSRNSRFVAISDEIASFFLFFPPPFFPFHCENDEKQKRGRSLIRYTL